MWEFEVFPEDRDDWNALELGLAELLRIFTPHTRTLQEYRNKYGVLLWCGQFSARFGAGPILSAEILKSLGDFGVPLELSVYCSDQES